ncbi:uncharacterized protein LOC133400943 isoform X2 [Phycodurus eques]|uniref:uncharacterized protein LOC133400943 isoform X2 n=1 Tax=Phycodurus eques TaxID=693459 RepID=UPI002ACDFD24|nr:uncharacterized protein LOC133400943 isoform X2 [Phycodurus eques]
MKLPSISIATTSPVLHLHSGGRPINSSTFPPISAASGQLSASDQAIPRLNPLCPRPVSKRTVSLETPSVHHHNRQRTLIMQRREYNRYHQVWQKPFYGTSVEKEEYRRDLREQLKKQVEEKSVPLKLRLASKAKEAEYLRQVDRLALSAQRERKQRHDKAMATYRDANKRVTFEMSLKDVASRVGSLHVCCRLFVCLFVCAADGAEVARQHTDALPGGPEGEGDAAPQPHQLDWDTQIGRHDIGGEKNGGMDMEARCSCSKRFNVRAACINNKYFLGIKHLIFVKHSCLLNYCI